MLESTVMTDRDVRQRGLVPPERLAQCDVLVIGVGAIGRQVALQLAALGTRRLTLFDDDIVQPENLAPQGYWPEDLHAQKLKPPPRFAGESIRRFMSNRWASDSNALLRAS